MSEEDLTHDERVMETLAALVEGRGSRRISRSASPGGRMSVSRFSSRNTSGSSPTAAATRSMPNPGIPAIRCVPIAPPPSSTGMARTLATSAAPRSEPAGNDARQRLPLSARRPSGPSSRLLDRIVSRRVASPWSDYALGEMWNGETRVDRLEVRR